jgi:hypothetical protein
MCVFSFWGFFAHASEPLQESSTKSKPGIANIGISLVGAGLGFGIGHAAQNRIHERPWLPIADVGALYLVAVGFLDCKSQWSAAFGRWTAKDGSGTGTCPALALGVWSAIALRVFQIGDVFIHSPVEPQQRRGLGIGIDHNSMYLAWRSAW